jgi:hypothetical protein
LPDNDERLHPLDVLLKAWKAYLSHERITLRNVYSNKIQEYVTTFRETEQEALLLPESDPGRATKVDDAKKIRDRNMRSARARFYDKRTSIRKSFLKQTTGLFDKVKNLPLPPDVQDLRYKEKYLDALVFLHCEHIADWYNVGIKDVSVPAALTSDGLDEVLALDEKLRWWHDEQNETFRDLVFKARLAFIADDLKHFEGAQENKLNEYLKIFDGLIPRGADEEITALQGELTDVTKWLENNPATFGGRNLTSDQVQMRKTRQMKRDVKKRLHSKLMDAYRYRAPNAREQAKEDFYMVFNERRDFRLACVKEAETQYEEMERKIETLKADIDASVGRFVRPDTGSMEERQAHHPEHERQKAGGSGAGSSQKRRAPSDRVEGAPRKKHTGH